MNNGRPHHSSQKQNEVCQLMRTSSLERDETKETMHHEVSPLRGFEIDD